VLARRCRRAPRHAGGERLFGIEILPHSIEARFASPKTFARKMETAYSAVVPAFVKDPDAFAAYVDAIEHETRNLVARYSDGNSLSFSMPVDIALARVGSVRRKPETNRRSTW
jgi:hypothetical protein